MHNNIAAFYTKKIKSLGDCKFLFKVYPTSKISAPSNSKLYLDSQYAIP